MVSLVCRRAIISKNLSLIHPWLYWIGLFSDRLCIDKVFKYIRNMQNLVLGYKLNFKVEGFV